MPDTATADLDSVCRLQRAAVAALAQLVVGWKRGATAEPVQALLRLGAPFHAPPLAHDCHPSGTRLPLAPATRGVEVELAFRLARDLPSRRAGYAPDELVSALASLHPALEIVGTREDRTALDGSTPSPISA